MASNERKIQAYMTREQTAEYFRSLARVLEGESAEAMIPELAGVKKFKLTLTPESDRFSLKCTVKHAKPEAIAEQEAEEVHDTDVSTSSSGRPKYKQLKKRMKKDFKQILEAAQQGALPAPGIVQTFLDDCDLMVTYPGKGDPYYDVFAKATHELSRAFHDEDLEAFVKACDKMDQIKHECHDRYE
jgi:XXXCH domain-containing protein